MQMPSFELTPTVPVSSSLEAQKGSDRVQDVAVQGIQGVAGAFLVLAVLVLVDHARPIQWVSIVGGAHPRTDRR